MDLSINERLSLLRKEHGLNKLQFAQIIDPESVGSDSSKIAKVTRLEEGKQEISLSELDRLIKHFEIDFSVFMGEKDTLGDLNDTEKDQILILIDKVMGNYLIQKNEPFKGNELGDILRRNLPTLLREKAWISEEYLVYGSAGIGQWSEVPWVAIFDKAITTSATTGIYIVVLFRADMKGYYISLNQGWTYYRERFGARVGKEKVKTVAVKLRDYISFKDIDDYKTEISLRSNGQLGRGYENGNIIAKYYDYTENVSDNQLVNSLRDFMAFYQQVAFHLGERSFDQLVNDLLHEEEGMFLETIQEEIKFQSKLNEISGDENYIKVEDAPRDIPKPLVSKTGIKTWPRSEKVARNALIMANYKCEYDENHQSFTSRKTGKMYCEAHHLIPLSLQGNIEFNYSLDVEANTICLCDTCHKVVHYAIKEEREKIIAKLYGDREERLSSAGILISLPLLLQYYNDIEE